ncbi:MAG: hypothetical protein QM486_09140 [Flavobacteriaceae bacterium]
MKRLLIITSLFLISFYSCSNKKIDASKSSDIKTSLLDTIKPKVNYKVHKEYDKDGNLISVDSTYSYIYSNGNISNKVQSKIFEQFKDEMSKSFPDFQNDIFDNFIKEGNINDSIFKNDFYSPNFFFRNQSMEMEMMLKRMDSIKNSFYKEQLKAYKKQI